MIRQTIKNMPSDSEILQKIPPHSIEAEQSLLGALLIDKDSIINIADIVGTTDFYKDAHGLIYQSMKELYEKRDPIDILSLSNRLEEKHKLEVENLIKK